MRQLRERRDDQPAFVLHTYPYLETSLIVEAFTERAGRVAMVARGAKRPRSELRGVLQAFQPLALWWAGTAELKTLVKAEWRGGLPLPGGAALLCGFYLNELLLKLLARHDAHAALFDAYAQTLPALGAADDLRAQAALRAFELVLLRETGVLPDLSVVTQTQQPLREGDRYSLSADAGIAAARDDGPALEAARWLQLQAALEHGAMEAIAQACRAALPELKLLLRNCLHYHLGSSPLRTRQVMLELQNP
jgi:DNA repair protein RecO (recombination protein O)